MNEHSNHNNIDSVYNKESMRRRLERFSRFNISGLCPTLKDTQPHFFESFNESHFALMFEFEHTIKAVRSQPFSISYTDDKKKRLYTPDFSLIYCDGSVRVVEVKHSKAIDEKTKRIHFLIEKAFEKLGFEFAVMTEKDLPSRRALSNMKMILRNALSMKVVNDEHVNTLLDVLPSELTLQKAHAICDALNLNRNLICHFILKDYVKIGFSLDICSESVLINNFMVMCDGRFN
ncbi:TnsA endonuclease N-terminal domain-containing protein [Pseudoalteromonas shioyasakiensis]|uniref:TnsA endonuclease N-terminal domain-containing protein n=1 Tax=Pseudoalteromonas shioyasakiensis TaxID=1190813 RepID=UPI0020958A2D|nr:TnsA endonuclease N-terminal domain-containing protein [Pseudoalteromonas shioyasakiensis]